MPIHNTRRVLVIEDNHDDFYLIDRQLKMHPCRFVVAWADNLANAVEQLANHAFDVVLSDLSLPDSHGVTTIAEIRRCAKGIPIIALTSLDDDRAERDVLLAGAHDYLVKGEFGGNGVARAIQHALQRQQAANDADALVAEIELSHRRLRRKTRLLRKKNERLRRLYRIAQEFVDNVSHDLRTPLTVISDYVAIIREGLVGEINNEQRTMLERVAVRTDDLNNMVDDLLDVSNLESGLLGSWRRSAHIQDILDRLSSLLQQRAKVRTVTLEMQNSSTLPQVYCDADQVGRIITNLVVNAIKFSGENGRVLIWTKLDPVNREIVVGVTDNGPGIDGGSLARIFERFTQLNRHLKPTVKGYGLGLNIAYRLCQLNLGELRVESQVGRGSTFSFALPLAVPDEIVKRWLATAMQRGKIRQLVQVGVPAGAGDAELDEFDAFLNCLLRRDDLIFRPAPSKWLVLMAVPRAESHEWRRRADAEFTRQNRNRPAGPLPSFRAEVIRRWPTNASASAILGEFSAAFDVMAKNCTEDWTGDEPSDFGPYPQNTEQSIVGKVDCEAAI